MHIRKHAYKTFKKLKTHSSLRGLLTGAYLVRRTGVAEGYSWTINSPKLRSTRNRAIRYINSDKVLPIT